MNCILLIIGCILMFYDSEQYSLLISIPPLLVADFYMVEHLFSILGLKYVVGFRRHSRSTKVLLTNEERASLSLSLLRSLVYARW